MIFYIFLSNLDVAWWVINRLPLSVSDILHVLRYFFWHRINGFGLSRAVDSLKPFAEMLLVMLGIPWWPRYTLCFCVVPSSLWILKDHSRDDMNAVTTWNIFKMQRSGSLVWIAKVKDEHGHWINPRLILILHVNASIGILIQVPSYDLRRVSLHSLISTPTEHGLFAKRHKKDLLYHI